VLAFVHRATIHQPNEHERENRRRQRRRTLTHMRRATYSRFDVQQVVDVDDQRGNAWLQWLGQQRVAHEVVRRIVEELPQ